MKNYQPYSDRQLGRAGSGHSVAVLGGGDLEVAFKSDSVENPGTIRTLIVKLRGVLYTAHVSSNLVSLRKLDADGLEYAGKEA